MAGHKRPIICFPAIDWGFLWHRPQQLMLRLAQAGHPVHYRNPFQVPGSAPEEVAPNLWVYRDFDKLPPQLAETAIYFVYFPAHAGWIDPSQDKFVIYDCIDDDPVFSGHEELMLKRADMVLCVSDALMKKHGPNHSRLLFLPNGVDINHYASEGKTLPPEMARIKAKGEAIIGFTGAMYTGWVDMELLYYLAEVRPQWQIVIIGETYHWDFSKAPANINHLGTRPYKILPSYIKYFDTGTIPFLDNQIARGADPVKLYEYLAAGLPVISRNLPFVKHLSPPLVYTYNTSAECVAAITQALEDNQKLGAKAREHRLQFATENTWESKLEILMTELKKLTWLEK